MASADASTPSRGTPPPATSTNSSFVSSDRDSQSSEFLRDLQAFCSDQDDLMQQAISNMECAFEKVQATRGRKARAAALDRLKQDLLLEEGDTPEAEDVDSTSKIDKSEPEQVSSPKVTNFWGNLVPNDGRDPHHDMKFISHTQRHNEGMPTSLTPMPHDLTQVHAGGRTSASTTKPGLSRLKTKRVVDLDVLSHHLVKKSGKPQGGDRKDSHENETQNRCRSCPPKDSGSDASSSASPSLHSNVRDSPRQPRRLPGSTLVRHLRRCSREFERHPSFSEESTPSPRRVFSSLSDVTQRSKPTIASRSESLSLMFPRRYSRLQSETSKTTTYFDCSTRSRSLTRCDIVAGVGASLLNDSEKGDLR